MSWIGVMDDVVGGMLTVVPWLTVLTLLLQLQLQLQ